MLNLRDHLPAGLLTGVQTRALFARVQAAEVAIPAINVVDSNSINAVLEAARAQRSPIIIQFSYGGAAFFAGKAAQGVNASVIGAHAGVLHLHRVAECYGIPVVAHTDHAAMPLLPWIDGLLTLSEAHYAREGRALFSSHMIDLSKEPLQKNLDLCCRYLERMTKIGVLLEIEVGCTGGEEDGVDNRHLGHTKLYTTPEEIVTAYERLQAISPCFTIAASFGNVHGVYAEGNVALKPALLEACQQAVAARFGLPPKPVLLVFHGSSGSDAAALLEAIKYGVVKVNIDTDTQWAAWSGLLGYYQKNSPYLQAQLGNPEGPTQPNKKFYDPRVWLRAVQTSMSARVEAACTLLGSAGTV